MDNPLPRHAANPTQQNIDAIAKLEHEALGRRTCASSKLRAPLKSIT